MICGSQNRETLEEAGYRLFHRINSREVLLLELDDGQDTDHLMLYCARDDFAGHVVEIDGVGYEFCSSVKLLI